MKIGEDDFIEYLKRKYPKSLDYFRKYSRKVNNEFITESLVDKRV